MKINKDFWHKTIWQAPSYYGFKAIAIVLALTIWCYVTIAQNPLAEGTYSVPVEFRNISDDLAVPDANYQVQVRLQGADSIIKNISSYNLVAYVDMKDMVAGEVSPEVRLEELPDGAALVSLSPESIQVTLEQCVRQNYELTVKTEGETAENYHMLEAVLSPQIVSISGAETALAQIETVQISANVDGLSANYSKNLPVEIYNSEGLNITDMFAVQPASVELLIPVVYDRPEASVTIRPVTVGDPADGYCVSRVIVEPSAVRVFANLENLSSLYYLETESIDISGLNSTTSFKAAIKYDSSFELAQETVQVVVQIEPVEELSLECRLLHTQNLAANLQCSLPDISVELLLSGASSYMDAISEEDIQLYVDCSSVTGPGSYTLPLGVTLPSGVYLQSSEPYSVTVEISELNSEDDA